MQVLTQMVVKGEFTKDSLVWANGMADWQKASEISAFDKLFGNSIPPVPPQMPPVPSENK